MAKVALVLMLCGLLASPCLSWDRREHLGPRYPEGHLEGPTLGVAATLEPCISVSVVTRPTRELQPHRSTYRRPLRASAGGQEDRLHFYATAGPGMYDADREAVLLVSSNQETWAVAIQAAPLTGDNGEIPADRVFAQTRHMDPDVNEGGGIGYVSIGSQRVAVTGTQTEGLEIPVRFRLKTTYSDKVGTYTGTIYFSYLMSP